MSNYLIRNQRYDDAIKYLNELVELDIATKEVFNSLGVAYKGLDNDAKAKEMFNRALKLDANMSVTLPAIVIRTEIISSECCSE